MFNLFRKSKTQAAEPSLDGIELQLREIPGAIRIVEKFPRVHWPAVHDAVARYANHPGLDLLWTEMAAQWLGVLTGHLGDHYQIYEGDHLLLLSPQSPIVARAFLTLGERAYVALQKLLQSSAAERGLGKHVIIVLENRDVYYDYVSHFHAERDEAYGTSAGMHFSSGYRHTAINGKLTSIEHTLVHELAHDMVWKHPLPLWLNEGLAQFAEGLVPGYYPERLEQRQVRLQQRYWTWFGMGHFWNGSSFSRVASQRLSYQLAKVLFGNLANQPRRGKAMADFIRAANHDDAGASACAQCFGCTLADLVHDFLGPGDWGPRPASAETRSSL